MPKIDTAMDETPIAESEIAQRVAQNPLLVITEPETFPALLATIHQAIATTAADVTTSKGRAALVSLSFKIRQTKAGIDKAVTAQTEGWRVQVAEMNAKRREVLPQLEALAKEVRRPVDEWEESEEKRREVCDFAITQMKNAALILATDTAERIESRLVVIKDMRFDETEFKDYLHTAQMAQKQAVEALELALPRLRQQERERAELEALRKADAERKAKEEADRIAAQKKAEDDRRAEALAERERVRKEQEDARIKQAEERAIERARQDAEEKASAERAQQAAEAQKAIDAANERTAAVERQRAAEIAQQAEEKRLADARTEKERRDEERRAANKRHIARVKKDAVKAVEAIILEVNPAWAGSLNDLADKIVDAIQQSRVPAVEIKF